MHIKELIPFYLLFQSQIFSIFCFNVCFKLLNNFEVNIYTSITLNLHVTRTMMPKYIYIFYLSIPTYLCALTNAAKDTRWRQCLQYKASSAICDKNIFRNQTYAGKFKLAIPIRKPCLKLDSLQSPHHRRQTPTFRSIAYIFIIVVIIIKITRILKIICLTFVARCVLPSA